MASLLAVTGAALAALGLRTWMPSGTVRRFIRVEAFLALLLTSAGVMGVTLDLDRLLAEPTAKNSLMRGASCRFLMGR